MDVDGAPAEDPDATDDEEEQEEEEEEGDEEEVVDQEMVDREAEARDALGAVSREVDGERRRAEEAAGVLARERP